MNWTPEIDRRLTNMRAARYTDRQIAAHLGLTKGQVSGRLFRLNNPELMSQAVRQTRAVKKTLDLAPVAPAPAEPVKLAPKPKPLPKPLHVGPGTQCRWPLGDPRRPGFHFCCDAAEPGRPYCAPHLAVAYVRVADAA